MKCTTMYCINLCPCDYYKLPRLVLAFNLQSKIKFVGEMPWLTLLRVTNTLSKHTGSHATTYALLNLCMHTDVTNYLKTFEVPIWSHTKKGCALCGYLRPEKGKKKQMRIGLDMGTQGNSNTISTEPIKQLSIKFLGWVFIVLHFTGEKLGHSCVIVLLFNRYSTPKKRKFFKHVPQDRKRTKEKSWLVHEAIHTHSAILHLANTELCHTLTCKFVHTIRTLQMTYQVLLDTIIIC